MRSNTHLSLVVLGVLWNLACGFSSSFHNKHNNNHRVINNKPIMRQRNTATSSASMPQQQKRAAVSFATTMNRGGDDTSSSVARKTTNALASFWATSGVVYILMKAVKRVLPIALEPFSSSGAFTPLTPLQLGAYISTCLYFAYVEGYKGFQLKFAPLVVARSFTLKPTLRTLHHTLLAPLYAMGLFHATKKRTIISWSVTLGVAGVVAAVKRLPYPYRNIVDAGVVVGLTWGTACIVLGYVKAVMKGGKVEGVDPALPEK